jgi:hypothetical protein
VLFSIRIWPGNYDCTRNKRTAGARIAGIPFGPLCTYCDFFYSDGPDSKGNHVGCYIQEQMMPMKNIFELAEKAGGFPLERSADNTFGFRERALRRFAGMIAKECIATIEGQSYNSGDERDRALRSAVNEIKEQFGVDE